MKKPSQVRATSSKTKRDRASDAPGRRIDDASEMAAFREEDVRRRAYELYEGRRASGDREGSAEGDWLAAEQELKALSVI